MTIQEFYLQLAKRGLNISLFFCLLAVVFLLLALDIPFPIVVLPFMFLSLCYFFIHLHYWRRAKIPLPVATVFPANHYLLVSQAPNYYFFLPNGFLYQSFIMQKTVEGEVFSTNHDRTYIMYRKGRKQHVITNRERVLLRFTGEEKHLFQAVPVYENMIVARYNRMNGLSFYKNERLIATLQKGWMPLDWLHLFRLNTPVLTFYEPVEREEKDAIFLASTVY